MFEFAKKEEEILKFWQERKIFESSLEKPSTKGNFVFYEGPPTANGKPGIHHVLARSFKDLIPRYKTMRGYHVERKAGWDTHGLPVELQVEKELGLSGKPDIEKYGVEAFNKKSRESVWLYKEEWERLTERMGYWVDMERPYITYESDYIESLWWVVKQIWDRDLIYQGFKVVPHCPRCGTALSSHEVAQGYKTVKDRSVYIAFKVTKGKGPVKDGDYILSWTTTPWTLPGNVALAVGSDIEYLIIDSDAEGVEIIDDVTQEFKPGRYIVAKESLTKHLLKDKPKEINPFLALLSSEDLQLLVEGKIEKSSRVRVMKGKDFIGVQYEPLFPGAVEKGESKAWEVVSADFVTTSDGTGVVHTAVMYGVDDYNLGVEIGLPQQHTVDTDGKFLQSVKGFEGMFVKDEQTEMKLLEYLKSRGNFFKEEMYKHEYPFCWRCGTPLLYYAKTSWFIAVSKIQKQLLKNAAEINWYPEHIKRGRFGEWLDGIKDWAISRERYWGTPLPIWVCDTCDSKRVIGSRHELGADLDDLHKPYIDGITFSCNCGGEMKRVPEVMDVWFDSGAMPFAQYHYPFENEELIDSGQAYPADYICEAIDQTRGWFYTLLAVSTLLNRGTSYKNVICLGHINDATGQKMSKSKGNIVEPHAIIDTYGADALRFFLFSVSQPGEPKRFDERQLADIQRKVFILLQNIMTFYETFSNGMTVDFKRPTSEDSMDRWILAETDVLVRDITDFLDGYKITEAARRLAEFINELSTWYVRRSRDRFKSDNPAVPVATLGYVLKITSQILAPFAPFYAEHIWQSLGIRDAQSVHLSEWPEVTPKTDSILADMREARDLVEAAHALRSSAKIKVRQPLAQVAITVDLADDLQVIVAEEINVKEVVVQKILPEGNPWMPHENKKIALNLELTAELKQEGIVRDLVRTANALRKKVGLTPQDRARIIFSTSSDSLRQIIIAEATRLGEASVSDPWTEGDPRHQSLEVAIGDETVMLSIA